MTSSLSLPPSLPPGRPFPGRGDCLPGEGLGEGGGAERSLPTNQRGVPEGHPAGGRAVVGRLPPGPSPLLLLPGRPREVLPAREQRTAMNRVKCGRASGIAYQSFVICVSSAQVQAGEGKVYKCLFNHKFEEAMSEKVTAPIALHKRLCGICGRFESRLPAPGWTELCCSAMWVGRPAVIGRPVQEEERLSRAVESWNMCISLILCMNFSSGIVEDTVLDA